MIKTDKRQKIIDAAIKLFLHTHDVKRVSLEAIAREANVSPTTIYNNFGTRERLVYEVVRALVRERIEVARALFHSDASFPQKLTGIMSGKLDVMSQVNSEIIAKMLSQDRTIKRFIDEIYESEIKPLWRVMLADGKKQGYIDPTLDEEALLIYLDVIKTGFAARADVLPKFQDNTKLLLQLAHLMFYGFLKKDIDLFGKEGTKSHDRKVHHRKKSDLPLR